MPKTGTTALEADLAPDCDIVHTGDPRVKHMTLRRFDRVMRPYLTDLGAEVETACTMRHPREWLSSWYRYRSRDAIAGRPNSTQGMDFDAFVAAYLEDQPPGFAKVGRPSRFVTGQGGRRVDHLFRYEAFDAYLAFLSDRFGRPVRPARQNASPDVAARLSPAMQSRLESALSEDFELWEQARVN